MTARPAPPPAVRWIVRTLEAAGHETWAVGGAVRDALLGRPSGDWDLTTQARPLQVRRLFRRTVPLGIEHGTVGVLARDGALYEVTTFRRDVETDGRHAVVAFADTLAEDLARRDFTINAMAWHPLREELFDPFGGAEDLKQGVLRTVGDPERRFQEDYLRILRALRFAGHFGLEIESGTWRALCSLVDHLPGLSAERIREELIKVLDADRDPLRSLELYAESGVLRVLYPELERLRHRPAADGLSEWTLALETARRLPIGRPDLRLASLLRGVSAADVAALLLRLRLSNARVDMLARLAGAAALPGPDADDAAFRRWLATNGPSRVSACARIELARAGAVAELGGKDTTEEIVESWRRARAVRATAPPLSVSALALDGRGLISLGLRPGPRFGRILDELLEWVLDDPARNRREVLERRALELSGEVSGG